LIPYHGNLSGIHYFSWTITKGQFPNNFKCATGLVELIDIEMSQDNIT